MSCVAVRARAALRKARDTGKRARISAKDLDALLDLYDWCVDLKSAQTRVPQLVDYIGKDDPT